MSAVWMPSGFAWEDVFGSAAGVCDQSVQFRPPLWHLLGNYDSRVSWPIPPLLAVRAFPLVVDPFLRLNFLVRTSRGCRGLGLRIQHLNRLRMSQVAREL